MNDRIQLHDPINHDHRQCPPFNSINHTIYGDCDCPDYGMIECCQENNFSFFHRIAFDTEHTLAFNSIDDPSRLPSNLLRKRLCKLVFHETDIGLLEKNERRKLPNCAVARIRQIYPSEKGDYMGFKEN